MLLPIFGSHIKKRENTKKSKNYRKKTKKIYSSEKKTQEHP